MDNTDTLLDFGDDTVRATPLSPTSTVTHDFASSAFDPFSSGPDDPFASTVGDFEFSANKGAAATNNSNLFDDFDPFLAPTSLTHASPSKQHFEDMEHHQGSTSPDANSFVDPFDPLVTGHNGHHDNQHHDKVSGGLVDVASDRGQDGAGNKGDKKALDYAKSRYEEGGRPELGKKIMREPKKLDPLLIKQSATDGVTGTEQEAGKKPGRVVYTGVGVEHNKAQYETVTSPLSPNDARSAPSSAKIPVNRMHVEKVAPPEITRNVRAIFEKGQFSDLHEAKRQPINIKDSKDAGVYENEPSQVREDVVKSSDMFNAEMEPAVHEGHTKSLLQSWRAKGTEDGSKSPRTAPIIVPMDGGCVLESTPAVRTDVVRCDSQITPEPVPQHGQARALREQFKKLNVEAPKERKQPIQLIRHEDKQAQHVFENQPDTRENVTRESYDLDYMKPVVEAGYAKNLVSQFLTKKEEKRERSPVIIDRQPAVVLENQPTVREGVVRESDVTDGEKIEVSRGHARNVANVFLNPKEDIKEKKVIVLKEAGDGPSVFENTPAVRDDVIKSDDLSEDILPTGRVKAKDIATNFIRRSAEPDTRPREKIVIDVGDGPSVYENTPIEMPDVAKGNDDYLEVVPVESGRAKNMMRQWKEMQETANTTKTSDANRAIIDIMAAKDAGVYENQPALRDDVARESDILETSELIPDNYARSMKNVWQQKNADADRVSERPAQLVRFTPPREKTPPPQQGFQSFQQLTLSSRKPTTPQSQPAAPTYSPQSSSNQQYTEQPAYYTYDQQANVTAYNQDGGYEQHYYENSQLGGGYGSNSQSGVVYGNDGTYHQYEEIPNNGYTGYEQNGGYYEPVEYNNSNQSYYTSSADNTTTISSPSGDKKTSSTMLILQ